MAVRAVLIAGFALAVAASGGIANASKADKARQFQQDADSYGAVEELYPAGCLSVRDFERIQWHACNGPGSVQFGQPGTDLRAFRMDCVEGRIGIAFPIDHDGDEGDPLLAELPDGSTLLGELIWLGDGTNFSAMLDMTDPLVGEIIERKRIDISVDRSAIEVPTIGGQAMMRELVSECEA